MSVGSPVTMSGCSNCSAKGDDERVDGMRRGELDAGKKVTRTLRDRPREIRHPDPATVRAHGNWRTAGLADRNERPIARLVRVERDPDLETLETRARRGTITLGEGSRWYGPSRRDARAVSSRTSWSTTAGDRRSRNERAGEAGAARWSARGEARAARIRLHPACVGARDAAGRQRGNPVLGRAPRASRKGGALAPVRMTAEWRSSSTSPCARPFPRSRFLAFRPNLR